MIHTIYTMTGGRYHELDETANLNLLKRWYVPAFIPIEWFNTEKYFEAHNNAFGKDTNLDKEAYNLRAYNTILMLDRMYKTMLVLMQAQNQRTVFDILLKRKLVNLKTNLKFYINKVKEITDIKIKDGNDLKRQNKEIQRRMDKYHENNQQPKDVTKADFMDLMIGVYSVIDMPLDLNITIAAFAKLKNRADKIIQKQSNGTK